MLRLAVAAAAAALSPGGAGAASAPLDARERRLANLRRLTAGGQNAEAYWDATGTRVRRRAVLLVGRTLHRLPRLAAAGQGLVQPRRLDIYLMNADGTGLRRVTRLAGTASDPYRK